MTFQMTDGGKFTQIEDFPTGFLGPFNVYANGKFYGQFSPGQSVTFDGDGVDRFVVTGIQAFDPNSETPFPLKLNYNEPYASFTITPSVPMLPARPALPGVTFPGSN